VTDWVILAVGALRTGIWTAGVTWSIFHRRGLALVACSVGVFNSTLFTLSNSHAYQKEWALNLSVVLSAPQVMLLVGAIAISTIGTRKAHAWRW